MDENLNFETYLFISSTKLIISVNTNLNKKIFQEELIFSGDNRKINFDQIDNFLNKNIFRIEKKLKNFVEKTLVILDCDVFFPIEISVKKKDNENKINFDNFSHILYDAKNYCKRTLEKKKIIHMLITNYCIDDKDYSFLPERTECNSISLDIKFICISTNIIEKLEKVLKKYHISLSHVVNANYIRKFLSTDESDIYSMAKNIINGHNRNEVMLVAKTFKNQGFFEKFFNFFN